MKTIRPGLLVAALLAFAAGCPPPNSGPPPLFNAVDPSVQCEAGQIGWDFSTGGNTDGIRRNSVGGTIAITEATFGGNCQADLTESFEGACDGYESCTLAVPGCTNDDVMLTYQCGTETPTYRAQLETGADGEQITVICGDVMTIVNAIYAPDADAPADITNALAAICTGKRRCANGKSAYELNNYGDPIPNVAKKVQVTYVCEAEVREQTVLVDDGKLDFYCDGLPPAPASGIEFIAIQTVVPRSTTTEHCPGSWCTQENLYDVYENGYRAYADLLFEEIVNACDLKRDCKLQIPQTQSSTYRNIKENTEEKDVLGIAMGPTALDFSYQEYVVGYTCGVDPIFNWKRIPRNIGQQGVPKLRLQCGEELKVTDVFVNHSGYTDEQKASVLEMYQANCDGKRVCYTSKPRGGYFERYFDENGIRRVDRILHLYESTIDVEYTCGVLDFAKRYVARVELGGVETSFECEPQRDDLFARGIRINTVTPVSRTQEMTKLCFGRDNCLLPGNTGEIEVTYRCGGGPELLSFSTSGGNSGNTIDCRPSASFRQRYFVDPDGIKVDLTWSRCTYETYQDVWWRPGSTIVPDGRDWSGCRDRGITSACPRNYSYDSNADGTNDKTVDLCTVDEFHWTFQCGPDPSNLQTFTSERGESPDWDTSIFPAYPRWIENISCEAPLTPYVNKKCVPKTCLGQTRRGEELECEADSTLVPVFARTTPVIKNYKNNPDGTTTRWGGSDAIENGVTTLRSGFPYQIYPFVSYQSPGGATQPVPENTDVTTWAYDVFELIDTTDTADSASQVQVGFRCLVNGTSVESAYTNYVGYWQVYAGGSATTVPDACYGHDKAKANDPSTSWYDAAKRSNLAESEFKRRYQRVETKLVSSLDAGGKNTVRWVGAGTYVSINPIGFFYDPVRDVVGALDFYGQTADFRNQRTVNFIESTEIEFGLVRQSVTADAFKVDVNEPTLTPQIAVDFSWYLRGNSVKNPYSPDTQDAAGAQLSLSHDNLRAVVEIAYSDQGNTAWTPVSAARFSDNRSLKNHNVYLQTERLQLTVSDLMRTRMLTVRGTNAVVGEKPNGWMKTFTDEDTVFKIRTCLVSDDFSFPMGESDTATAEQSANGYSLKLMKRCTTPNQLVLKRELFVTPETVAASVAAETEGASMGNSGDSDVKANGDTGSQTNCTTRCMTNADCGGATCSDGKCQASPDQQRCSSENRTSSGSGVGSTNISLYANRTDNSTTTENGQTNTNTANVTELLGFAVMNIVDAAGAAIEDAVSSYDFTIDIAFKLPKIIDAARDLKNGPKPKKLFSIELGSKEVNASGVQRYGIQLVIAVTGNFTIGPFPLTVTFAWTTALVPHLTLGLAGGRFTEPGNNPALSYPCFLDANGNGSKCYTAESATRSFADARTACGEKGGRLATAYTSAEATALSAAAAGNGSNPHWIGAVPQYIYQYSACADLGTPQATPIPAGLNCAERSRTRYTWLTASPQTTTPSFAAQTGLSTSFTGVALPGSLSMVAGPSYVTQGLAGLYYQQNTQKLGHRPNTDELAYVCEYDPASVVKANRQDISIALEVMSALRLEVCTPSADFGVCLEGRLKFFTIEMRFGIELTRADIYGPHPDFPNLVVPYTTLSGTNLYGRLSASALAVDINVILRFIFWDTRILIKKFDPVATWKKPLFLIPNNSYQSHLESP